jgi:hypothetical protein
MAKFVATDYNITIGGTDFSSSIASAELSIEVDDVETTAFGDSSRTRVGGLQTGTLTLDFHQDFGSSSVDATLEPLIGTSAAIVIKPTSAATAATNPTYSFNCLVTQYSPFASSVGDLATLSVTWPVTGDITRAES